MSKQYLFRDIEEAESPFNFELTREMFNGLFVVEGEVNSGEITANSYRSVIVKEYPATRYEPPEFDTREIKGDDFTGSLTQFKEFLGSKDYDYDRFEVNGK